MSPNQTNEPQHFVSVILHAISGKYGVVVQTCLTLAFVALMMLYTVDYMETRREASAERFASLERRIATLESALFRRDVGDAE